MPLLESACISESCPAYGEPVERYEHHYVDTDPTCSRCGGPTRRLLSVFRSPFCGDITARYNDRDKSRPDVGEHWVWERNTPDGKPRPRLIRTWQDQKDFCRNEKLIRPTECSRNLEPGDDGKGYKNSVGMPGCEV